MNFCQQFSGSTENYSTAAWRWQKWGLWGKAMQWGADRRTCLTGHDRQPRPKPSQQSVRGSRSYFTWPLNYGENKPSSRHGGWGHSFKYCLQAWVATSVLADCVWSEISRYITYLFSRQKGQSSVSGSQHSFFFVAFFLLSSCIRCAIRTKEENILITRLLYILITFVIQNTSYKICLKFCPENLLTHFRLPLRRIHEAQVCPGKSLVNLVSP